MKHLIFSLLLVFASSCSKTSKHTKVVQEFKNEQNTVSAEDGDVESLKDLMHSDRPNAELTKILLKTIPEDKKAAFKKSMLVLNEKEAKDIVSKVIEQSSAIKRHYLYHRQSYQSNDDLTNTTYGKYLKTEEASIGSQLRVSVFAYLRNKSLNEIISTYDSRALEISRQIALNVAFDIALNFPETAKTMQSDFLKMKQEDFIAKIKKAKEITDKVDEYFKSSALSEDQQYGILLSAAVAGGVYYQLSQYQSFQNILVKAKRLYLEAVVIQKKAQEAAVLIKTLNQHFESVSLNMRELSEAIKGSRQDVKFLTEKIKTGQNTPEARQVITFLSDKVSTKSPVGSNQVNESILSTERRVSANVIKGVSAVSNAADSLSNILATTSKLATLVGLKPSKDMQKAIETAQTVCMIASGAKAAIAGWAMGGPVGALGALSSSPAMASLMGGGNNNANEFKAINMKLDMILKNQEIMMSMQKETMKMIRDLALLVDKYHQEDLLAMAELRDLSLVNGEISKSTMNKDLRGCERLVNAQLQKEWKNFDMMKENAMTINNLSSIKKSFETSLIDLSSINRMLSMNNNSDFSSCNDAIANTFSGTTNAENPVRAVFESSEVTNLVKFDREKYKPNLTLLKDLADSSDLSSVPLHIPSLNLRILDQKMPYLDHAKEQTSNDNLYELDQLISSKTLERYVTNLLIFHPYFEVNTQFWNSSVKEVAGVYMNRPVDEQNKGQFFLGNALKLTQTAIAQETILAGEMLLPSLYLNNNSLFSAKKCGNEEFKTKSFAPDIGFVCSLRSNVLLMKNLVMFTLHKNGETVQDFYNQYEQAYKNKDLAFFSSLLGTKLKAENFKVDSDEIFVQISGLNLAGQEAILSIVIPTKDELMSNEILYSENMPRLLLLQDALIEALENVTPVENGDEYFKLMMMGA